MEAPDRIYTDENGNNPLLKRHCDSDIEYIRTDAFIEKACDAYCKVCKMPNCRSKECKWLSDFKEYMKGE